ncbi:MAG: hypothetical protein ACHQ50_17850 [Fimbriimonadales bacterium]
MPIRLNVEITGPMTPDDHELLSGVSVLLLAIANHELAKSKFPEAFGEDDGLEGSHAEEPVEPQPCTMTSPAGSPCVREVGHVGRHRFRPVTPPVDPALVN